jgi:hypothetical protein
MDEDRKLYTWLEVLEIYKQPYRRQYPRPKTLLLPGLVKQWKDQDLEIIKAGGWQADDYHSVPGKDGFPPGYVRQPKKTNAKSATPTTTKPVPQKRQRTDADENEDHSDEEDSDDDGAANSHEHGLEDDHDDEEPDDDDDLVERLIRSYDTSNIKMPTKDAMKADLKKWGKWKPDGRRNQGDIFREMWLPEFLRRRTEAEAAETWARKAPHSTDTMGTERDRTEERTVNRTAKRKEPTPAATTSVTQKQKSCDTDEPRPQKRRKSAGTYGAPDTPENDAQPERGVFRQDEMQKDGVYRDMSKSSKLVTFQFPTRMKEVSRMFGASSEQISNGLSEKSSEALVPQSFQSYTKSPNNFFLVATLVF